MGQRELESVASSEADWLNNSVDEESEGDYSDRQEEGEAGSQGDSEGPSKEKENEDEAFGNDYGVTREEGDMYF